MSLGLTNVLAMILVLVGGFLIGWFLGELIEKE